MSDADSRSYRVLCVGGPLDGRWRTVQGRSFEAAEAPKVVFTTIANDAIDEPLKRHHYDVEAVSLFGYSLHVAICDGRFEDSRDRERAIMRAVLRRDVANHMEGL